MEGEDLQILELTKKIKNGFYVDAGCYHPTHLSNTFLLYKKNWNGINIDVSELSISLFNFMRSNDLNLNLAISNFEGEVTIYHQKKMSQLTTINKKISTERMQGKIKERKIKSQKLTTVLNNSKYKNRKIDFLNIDVEGVDLEVLKSLDFKVYRPRVICIEIIDKKIEDSKIYNYLKNLDYKKVWSSSSNISHIFVEK
tara:strand:- start:845 stop:1438 length:594 start_codon:yes stop_codon:yes gene_type:complete